MKFTKNFNFKKPEPLDTVDINDINDSFDLIDEKLKETEEENKRLDSTFKELIINAGNSNAEIVDARGQGFDTLRDRLDNSDNEMNNLDDRVKKIETLQEENKVEMSTATDYIVIKNTKNGQITDIKIEGNTLIVNEKFEEVKAGTTGATLKSVGDGVDAIEILSRKEDGNLFNSAISTPINIANGKRGATGYFKIRLLSDKLYCCLFSNEEKISSGRIAFRFKDINGQAFEGYVPSSLSDGYSYISLQSRGVDYKTVREIELFWDDVAPTCTITDIYVSNTPMTSENIYIIDNKQILFKNKNGNYEKVILRSLPNGIKDTIEKHSDGKDYYHKRCEKLVLNGSESWVLNNSISVYKDTSLKFETSNFSNLVMSITDANISNHIISDKFKSSTDSANHSDAEESITQTVLPYNSISIRISKSKLSSQDAQGFTTWLKSNNVTVVVALAKEEVYECTNLDLDSYEGETSIICNSNIPPSNMSFKIANHISNTVEIMKDRINDTETKITEILNSDMMQNLGTTGYKILPGGLILQWGVITFTTQNNEGLFDAKVTFPISFPNRCFICTPTLDVVDSNGWGEVDNYIAHAYSLSGSSCNVRGKSIKTTTMNKSGFFRYLAIGY